MRRVGAEEQRYNYLHKSRFDKMDGCLHAFLSGVCVCLHHHLTRDQGGPAEVIKRHSESLVLNVKKSMGTNEGAHESLLGWNQLIAGQCKVFGYDMQ